MVEPPWLGIVNSAAQAVMALFTIVLSAGTAIGTVTRNKCLPICG